MLVALRHRGPDDEGVEVLGTLAMGMRRLSILDPTPAGHQPMASADGRAWIVFNGEIYNFQELARELETAGCRFESASDTEVILAAYTVWGPECVERFNGIWAFALWDTERELLLLSRDRFGVKPLFVAESAGRLAFASEIKALRRLPWVSDEPDVSTVRDYLVDERVDHTDHTFFRAIRQIPTGHNLIVTREAQRSVRYWGPPPLSDDARARPDATDARRIDEVRDLLVDAVALQLRSDVTVGSCLSGGLDSSSIVSIAAGLRDGSIRLDPQHLRDRETQPHMAFFAEFHDEGIDERRFVDAVASAAGLEVRSTTPTAETFRRSIGEIVRAQDEPFTSTSIFAQYEVMRIAHEAGIKVLLDGQGADEMFGGYHPFLALAAASGALQGDGLARRMAARAFLGSPSEAMRIASNLVLKGRPIPRRFRRNRMPDSWVGEGLRRSESLERPIHDIPGTPLAQGLWRQIASDNLPMLLRYEDRNSMAFGIEARVPFLDHRLVEASLLLPDRLKAARGERKIALRRAVAGVVPQVVLDRTDKIAFQTPERDWLLGIPDWSGPGAEEAAGLGFTRRDALSEALTALREGRIGSRPVWRILCLQAWLASLRDPTPVPAA